MATGRAQAVERVDPRARGLRLEWTMTPIGASMAGKAAEFATLALLATLVPRLLGPAEYGRLALALSIVMLGSLAMALEGPALMSRFLPATATAERAAVARALALRVGAMRLTGVVAVALVAVVLVATAPATFPPMETALIVSALALDVAATLAAQVALGLGHTRIWSFRFPLQNSVLIVGVLVLHALAGPPWTLAALAVSSGVAVAFCLRAVGPVLRRAGAGAAVPPGALRFGAAQAVGGAMVLLQHRAGILAVAVVAGSSVETGYAALAAGVALALTYVVWQAFAVELPGLAGGVARDALGVESRARRLARGSLVVVVPAALAGALLLGPAISMVFGDEFSGAERAFAPALALLPFAPLTALARQVAILRLASRAYTRVTGAGAVASLAVMAFAVPAWGAAGATLGLLAGAAASSAVAATALPGAIGRPELVCSFAAAAMTLGIGLT